MLCDGCQFLLRYGTPQAGSSGRVAYAFQKMDAEKWSQRECVYVYVCNSSQEATYHNYSRKLAKAF